MPSAIDSPGIKLTQAKACDYPQPSASNGREKGNSYTFELTVRYSKTGDMRFFSHLDLIRLFQRAVRRAGLPIALSRGFHTRPEISFGPALKLGKESMNEYARFKLTTPVEPEEFSKRLQGQLPEGIKILEVSGNE